MAALAAIAANLLAHDDPGLTPDAFRIALCVCDLSLRVESGGWRLDGQWACYDATRSHRQQQYDVACCVAEWALRQRGLPVTDFAVLHLAGLLVAPRSRARLRAVAVEQRGAS